MNLFIKEHIIKIQSNYKSSYTLFHLHQHKLYTPTVIMHSNVRSYFKHGFSTGILSSIYDTCFTNESQISKFSC